MTNTKPNSGSFKKGQVAWNKGKKRWWDNPASFKIGVYVSAKNAGNFVLTHGVAAGTETADWVIIN